MASPSERLGEALKRRYRRFRGDHATLADALVAALRMRDPALKAFFWINFILPAVYVLYISQLGSWSQSAVIAPFRQGLADGTFTFPELYADPARAFMISWFPLELMLLSFLVLQVLNLRCMKLFPDRKRLFRLVLAGNFLAPLVGSIGILPVLPRLPFDLATYAVHLWLP
ncbi:hypothetical protein [uncultured Martelella sp.]|uniref:hypothetical protein n=1 Tax=uncultured Martelella sp. TaxID=392331 RepID=UPI0029C81FB5|nr:hypothetical protein [uncultured Martelella sp.]